jgi:DnaJ homologue, subfamily C, member 28, conserved domain
MELRDGPGRRRKHLGGSLLVSPSVPESTEDDRSESYNDQDDQADGPRIHLFRLPHRRVVPGGPETWRCASSSEKIVSHMRYESWVERQVREAIERGEFDNLPGQGKPIKGLNGRDDENWWVKSYLEREQLPLPLPTSLALRKEVMELPETVADVPDEESVREIVKDLNHRIALSHRIRAHGPPIVIGLVDVERAVADWRRRRR